MIDLIPAIEIFISCGTLIVLTLTLYWIIKYTKSAEKQTNQISQQNKEMIKQRELSVLPSLNHEIINQSVSDFSFELCNIGYGPALNIYIDPVKFDDSVSFKFEDRISLLRKDDKINVFCACYKDGEKCNVLEDRLFHFFKRKYTLKFYFQDIQGNYYTQSNSFKNDKLHISSVTKYESLNNFYRRTLPDEMKES